MTQALVFVQQQTTSNSWGDYDKLLPAYLSHVTGQLVPECAAPGPSPGCSAPSDLRVCWESFHCFIFKTRRLNKVIKSTEPTIRDTNPRSQLV